MKSVHLFLCLCPPSEGGDQTCGEWDKMENNFENHRCLHDAKPYDRDSLRSSLTSNHNLADHKCVSPGKPKHLSQEPGQDLTLTQINVNMRFIRNNESFLIQSFILYNYRVCV